MLLTPMLCAGGFGLLILGIWAVTVTMSTNRRVRILPNRDRRSQRRFANEGKKNSPSPIAWALGQAGPHRGQFALSVILGLLGVAFSVAPYLRWRAS